MQRRPPAMPAMRRRGTGGDVRRRGRGPPAAGARPAAAAGRRRGAAGRAGTVGADGGPAHVPFVVPADEGAGAGAVEVLLAGREQPGDPPAGPAQATRPAPGWCCRGGRRRRRTAGRRAARACPRLSTRPWCGTAAEARARCNSSAGAGGLRDAAATRRPPPRRASDGAATIRTAPRRRSPSAARAPSRTARRKTDTRTTVRRAPEPAPRSPLPVPPTTVATGCVLRDVFLPAGRGSTTVARPCVPLRAAQD